MENWDAYIAVASLSDIGMRRSNNQDNLSISMASNLEQWHRRGHLFIVADGMGAHAAGELASKMAVDQIPHLYAKYDDLPAHEALRKSVIDANSAIHRRGQANEEFHNMGTTCSTLLLMPAGAIVAHVGDSRVYRQRKGRFEQLTFDHSLVWEMRKSGQISEAELQSGKIPKNVITRSLGPYPESKVDLEGPFPIAVGDRFLLCSDGLTGLVEDSELGPLIANLNPEEAARVLVDLANLRGGHDNITCIIVEVKDARLATSAESQNVVPASRTRSAFPIHPLTIAVLIGSLVIAAVFFLLDEKVTALIPALIFLGALIWMFVQLIRAGTSAEGGSAPRFGSGPYVQLDCASGKAVIGQLETMTGQLIDAITEQGFEIDMSQLQKMSDKAKAASGENAIRAHARLISFLMEQLRG